MQRDLSVHEKGDGPYEQGWNGPPPEWQEVCEDTENGPLRWDTPVTDVWTRRGGGLSHPARTTTGEEEGVTVRTRTDLTTSTSHLRTTD